MRHKYYHVSVCIFLSLATTLQAARIGDISELNWLQQAQRFCSLQDISVQHALLGSIFMGICCGILGSFIVVRKLSLIGDTLSHAVMPGVALGFLWAASKDPIAIFIGATIAGIAGTGVMSAIKGTTRIKDDSAMGMVLSGFYALGICLFVMIQRLEGGHKSGIDKFLFGQAAALSSQDLWLMGIVTLACVLLLMFFYKELLCTSFDSSFASSIGISKHFFHYLLMLFLAFTVVISIQATGIVLVSAMLITPAATAYLLTDSMRKMLLLAIIFGIFSGIFGSFLSFLGNSLPTGPFMILTASLLFLIAFIFAPHYGMLPKYIKRYRQ